LIENQALKGRQQAGFAGSLSWQYKLKQESEGLRLNLNSRLKLTAKPPRCRPFRARFFLDGFRGFLAALVTHG
jgi:hypothetical protein